MREQEWQEFDTIFECEVPPVGVPYQVIRQQWSADGTERRILEVRLCSITEADGMVARLHGGDEGKAAGQEG